MQTAITIPNVNISTQLKVNAKYSDTMLLRIKKCSIKSLLSLSIIIITDRITASPKRKPICEAKVAVPFTPNSEPRLAFAQTQYRYAIAPNIAVESTQLSHHCGPHSITRRFPT